MADCAIRSSQKSRLIRRGLMTCGWLVVAVIFYVASIGPMVFMESQGFGTDETWQHLQQTVYRPVYGAWRYGPKWLGTSLSRYTTFFELAGVEAENLGSKHNDFMHDLTIQDRVLEKREQDQLEWDNAHPAEAKIRKEEEAGILCMLYGDPTKEEIEEAENSWWWSTVR